MEILNAGKLKVDGMSVDLGRREGVTPNGSKQLAERIENLGIERLKEFMREANNEENK